MNCAVKQYWMKEMKKMQCKILEINMRRKTMGNPSVIFPSDVLGPRMITESVIVSIIDEFEECDTQFSSDSFLFTMSILH